MRLNGNRIKKYAAMPTSAPFMNIQTPASSPRAAMASTGTDANKAGNTMRSGIRYTRKSMTDTHSSTAKNPEYGTTTHQSENLFATSANSNALAIAMMRRLRGASGSGSGSISAIVAIANQPT